MKLFVTFFSFLFLIAIYKEEVSSQVLYPGYGGVPIPYENHEDDDLGLLLTVLLLATRNKNGGNCNCCNCCNCGSSSKSIPVPYPIPFPTNNPIINHSSHFDDYDDEDGEYEVKTFSKGNSFEKNTTDSDITVTYTPVKVPIDGNSENKYTMMTASLIVPQMYQILLANGKINGTDKNFCYECQLYSVLFSPVAEIYPNLPFMNAAICWTFCID